MGGVPNAPGPSPTLGSLGPSHQWRYKSRAPLRGPPCAHGVAGTPQGEVRDSEALREENVGLRARADEGDALRLEIKELKDRMKEVEREAKAARTE